MEKAVKALMEKQLSLHKSLLQLSEAKTDCLKKNDLQSLQEILKAEQTHVAAINQLEKQRAKEMGSISLQEVIQGISSETEKNEFVQLTTNLQTKIREIKLSNERNQQLLEQSLQFVQLSLDLLDPEPDMYLYSNPQDNGKEKGGRSLFDSKA